MIYQVNLQACDASDAEQPECIHVQQVRYDMEDKTEITYSKTLSHRSYSGDKRQEKTARVSRPRYSGASLHRNRTSGQSWRILLCITRHDLARVPMSGRSQAQRMALIRKVEDTMVCMYGVVKTVHAYV